MSGTLEIRDPAAYGGTPLTVDLENADNSGPWLDRGGYSQESIDTDPVAAYVPIEEEIRVIHPGADSGDREDFYRDINKIGEAAERRANPNDPLHRDLANRARIQALGYSENSPGRYSILSAARVLKMDPRHYGGGPVSVPVMIKREPFWRVNVPGTWSNILSEQIDNHDYGGNVNYVQVEPTQLTAGDVASPIRLNITDNAGIYGLETELIVAWLPQRYASAQWPTTYYPAAAYTSITAGSVGAASGTFAIPGGQMWTITGTTNEQKFTMTWNLSLAGGMWGRFGVYAFFRTTDTPPIWRAELRHGAGSIAPSYVSGIGARIMEDVSSSLLWPSRFIGNITMPAAGHIPGESYASPYELKLDVYHLGTSSNTAYIGGLFLVPLDGWVWSLSNSVATFPKEFWLDSDTRSAWVLDSSGDNITANLPVQGLYPTLKPTENGRMYFYHFSKETYRHEGSVFDVVLDWSPRVKNLRIT